MPPSTKAAPHSEAKALVNSRSNDMRDSQINNSNVRPSRADSDTDRGRANLQRRDHTGRNAEGGTGRPALTITRGDLHQPPDHVQELMRRLLGDHSNLRRGRQDEESRFELAFWQLMERLKQPRPSRADSFKQIHRDVERSIDRTNPMRARLERLSASFEANSAGDVPADSRSVQRHRPSQHHVDHGPDEALRHESYHQRFSQLHDDTGRMHQEAREGARNRRAEERTRRGDDRSRRAEARVDHRSRREEALNQQLRDVQQPRDDMQRRALNHQALFTGSHPPDPHACGPDFHLHPASIQMLNYPGVNGFAPAHMPPRFGPLFGGVTTHQDNSLRAFDADIANRDAMTNSLVLDDFDEQRHRRILQRAGERRISALKIKRIVAEDKDEDGHATCKICLEDVDVGAEVRAMKCRHWYHPACIGEWLKEEASCPTCRADMRGKPQRDDIEDWH